MLPFFLNPFSNIKKTIYGFKIIFWEKKIKFSIDCRKIKLRHTLKENLIINLKLNILSPSFIFHQHIIHQVLKAFALSVDGLEIFMLGYYKM